MPTAKKVEQVAELQAKFAECGGCWFVDARGLTVAEVSELRKNIREAGGSMHVYKNKLAQLALSNLEQPNCADVLAGPTAFIFCGADIAAPAKAVKVFAKAHDALEMKGGIVDGVQMSAEEAMAIADLPSKEVLLAMVLGTMQAPISSFMRVANGTVEGFARCCKQIAEQK